MLRFISILVSAILFASCTSIKSLPEDELSTIVDGILNEPSKVDNLELSLLPDYTKDRITLVRTYSVSTDLQGATRSKSSPDSILGIYFGNGLYLDNNNNLVIRLDRLAGIEPTFIGKTVYNSYTITASGSQPIERVSNFSNGSVETKVKGMILSDESITYDDKKAKGTKETIYFNKKNVKITPSIFIPLVSKEVVWEAKDTSLRKTWGLLKYNEYVLSNGKITDKEKNILVENNGTYLRFAYTKGNQYAYRFYKTDNLFLIVNENTGETMPIQIEGRKLLWQQNTENIFGKTDKKSDYSYGVID